MQLTYKNGGFCSEGKLGDFFRVNAHKDKSIDKEDRCQKFNMAANSSEGFPP